MTIPAYKDIAEKFFGTLWQEAQPADWALVAWKLSEQRAEVVPKWTPTDDEMQFARDIVGTPGFYTGAAVLVAKALLRIGMNKDQGEK